MPERADHLLLRCPRLAWLRAETFKSWGLDFPPNWEVDWIVRFISDPGVASMEDPTDSPDGAQNDREDDEDQSASEDDI